MVLFYRSYRPVFSRWLFLSILSVFFFLSIDLNAQQWNHNFVPRQRDVNGLAWLGPETILFGGGFNAQGDSLQEIWLSTDLGFNWDNVNNISTPPWIKSLAF